MKKAIVLTLLLLALVCGLIEGYHKIEARSASRRVAAGPSTQGGPSFSINDVTVTEGTNPTAVFTVTLNFPGTLRDFITTVDYTTSNGSATAPGDYAQSSGTVTFLPGPTPGGSVSLTISIPIVNDALAEATETFTVTLSNASPAFPILRSGTCTILDNDGPPPNSPTLSVNDVSVTEGNAGTINAVFTVSLSTASNLGVTVDFATADGTATVADNDYNSASGTLVFSPLVTTMTISVVIVGDTRGEANENFFVNLRNPSFATIADGQGVGTIVDDDAPPPTLPALSISDVTAPEGNAGVTNVVFTVSISTVPSSQVTVNFATADGTATVADGDYSSVSGILTFPPGDNTPRTISVAVVGDPRTEGNENFFVNLSNPSGATIADGQGIGVILDDDQVPGCSYTVSPTSQTVGPGLEEGAFTVISPDRCGWTASSADDWIITSPGTPLGGVHTSTYRVEPNEGPSDGSSNRREGKINIIPIGATTPAASVVVIQAGLSCTFSVSPLEIGASSRGGPHFISVRAPQHCPWKAESRSSFIGVSTLSGEAPGEGEGNGTVVVGVQEHVGSFRTGEILVAGQIVKIHQATFICPEEFICELLPTTCDQTGSNLLGTSRRFRDEVLAANPRGQRYTRLYYDFSGEIVQQMIFHPSLVLRSLEIKERYLPVIEAMVMGQGPTLTVGDLEEIDGFLNTIGARGSSELQGAIKVLRADLRDPQAHAEFGVKVIAGPKRELAPAVGGWWPKFSDWFSWDGARSRPDTTPVRIQKKSESDRISNPREAFGKLPMRFELNQGQSDSRANFIARGPGYSLFLSPAEATLKLRNGDRGSRVADRGSPPSSIFNPQSQSPNPQSDVLRMKLAGANQAPKITGLDELPGKTNYFTGQDQSHWRAQVPSFARVKYENVYKGVDLVYYGNQGQLEYDFIVAPGADPSAIRLAFEGVRKIELDASGDLALHTAGGHVRQRKPLAYQEVNGIRREIPSYYAIRNQEVAFDVGDYDATKPLIIDPVLVYSTYLGGSGVDEGSSITVDADGQVYVAGFTESLDFPLAGASQSSAGGEQDAFVAKLNAAGTQLIYATYLGGSARDIAVSVATDSSGAAYVTGFTASPNFPALNAVQPARRGSYNSFVTKLNPAGGVVYSTYLGGGRADFGSSVTVDDAGNVYVAGLTTSTDFPMANALQPAFGGISDVYLTKLDPTGAQLVFSTYLGGAATDGATSVAVDAAGNIYVAGVTLSSDLRTVNPLQASRSGGLSDGFVAKLNPTGSELIYATYLGGGRADRIFRLAVDAAGAVYVTGDTDSSDFPTVSARQPFYRGGTDAFVAKINPSGSALVYSTYLGGDGIDGGAAIAVEPSGNVVVTGFTSSANFPTVSPVRQANAGGSFDAFVARLDQQGRLNYSTYLGGRGSDTGFGVAVDASGAAYVMGLTDSTNFPVANPLQASNGGAYDIFIAKINPVPAAPIITDAEVLRDGKLLVIGAGFDRGAQVLLNDQPQPTRNDLFSPETRLIVDKITGEEIRRGERVTLLVRNLDGTLSPEFIFIWPVRAPVRERRAIRSR
ncbi:MAG TPA: SBBP repeat-containing protein [Blastocatellia bacterium]|nr:SBBP repeat-containing protein [Blastocatellia bacterium]